MFEQEIPTLLNFESFVRLFTMYKVSKQISFYLLSSGGKVLKLDSKTKIDLYMIYLIHFKKGRKNRLQNRKDHLLVVVAQL